MEAQHGRLQPGLPLRCCESVICWSAVCNVAWTGLLTRNVEMNCNAARNESRVRPFLIAGEPGGPGNDNGNPATVPTTPVDKEAVDKADPEGEKSEIEIA